MLEFAEELMGPKIKVVGVGGGGGNAVNTMIEAGVQGVDFIAANTDGQVLETNLAPVKIQLGRNLTKGLGAGANPEIGCAAAIEDAAKLGEVLAGADMVFVTAGMGGGTGTGAAPVIAQVARDLGALTVGVVTRPFMFEGMQRKKKATSGIGELAKSVDALIVIPNDRLVALAGKKMTLRESFAMVDNVCLNAVRGISDLVLVPGLINVDFADVRTIMTGMGRALMGTGRGVGDKRAIDAAQAAINSPLLEDVSINGATGILVNITGGADLTLAEVTEACTLIQEAADPDANIIFGSVIDPNMADEVRITVIATGFQSRQEATIGGSLASGRTGRRPDTQMSLPIAAALSSAGFGAPAEATLQGFLATAKVVVAARAPETTFEVVLDEPTLPQAIAVPLPPPFPQSPSAAVTVSERIPTFPSTVPIASAAPPAASQFATAVPVDYPTARDSGSMPIIRPAVASSQVGAHSATSRRTPSAMPAASLNEEDLGIAESEFDRPTYMRRAVGTQTQPATLSAPTMRLPGDSGGGGKVGF